MNIRLNNKIFFLLIPILLSAWAIPARADITTGLQIDWSMDDGSGTSVTDSSGNNNTGSIVTNSGPASSWVPGLIGSYALSLNGTDTQVQLSSPLSLGASYTFASWVYLKAVSGDGEGTIFNQDGTTELEYFLVAGSYYLNFYNNGTDIGASVNTIPTNTWVHVAAVCNAGTLSYYINGIFDSNASGACPSFNFIDLGNDPPYGEGIQAEMDESRVYNRALTDADIAELYDYTGPNSLVGWWKLDEGSGTMANDSSGSGHTGTLSSPPPAWVSGRVGSHALSFDGANNIVDIGNGLDNLDQRTVSAWVYVNSFQNNRTSILAEEPTSNCGWWFTLNGIGGNNRLEFHYCPNDGQDGIWDSPDNSLTTGQWYFLAASFDRTNIPNNVPSIYINGVKQTITTVQAITGSTVYPETFNIAIGGNTEDSTERADAIIDDVRIYNRLLSDNEVQELYLSTQSNAQLAWWKLDEGSGASTADSSGFGHTGTLATTGSTLPSWTTGKLGNALSFDGSTNFVDSTSFADNLSDFTVSAWFKTSAIPSPISGGIITAKMGAGGIYSGEGWVIAMGNTISGVPSGGINTFIQTDGSNWLGQNTTGTYNDGNWHHVAMVVSGGNSVTLYVDGSTAGTEANNGGTLGLYTNSADVMIANDIDGEFFNGDVDDVHVYNYALTASQVLNLYNSGADALLAWWRFDEGSLTSTADSSGNGHTGTLNNAPAWITGKYGKALQFAGGSTGGYVGVPYTSSLALNSDMSFSFWVKRLNPVATQYDEIFQKGTLSEAAQDIELAFQTTGVGCGANTMDFYSDGTNGAFSGAKLTCMTSTVTDSKWHFVTVTISETADTVVTFYLDGKLSNTVTVTNDNISNNLYNLWLGSSGTSGGDTLNGNIDEFRIYNYVLTPGQVFELFENSAQSHMGTEF
jgi:hypothetical protein